MIGIVKWFSPIKGYGFIEPKEGGKDAFVHLSAVQLAGETTLSEGQTVAYEMELGVDGRKSASNIRIIPDQN